MANIRKWGLVSIGVLLVIGLSIGFVWKSITLSSTEAALVQSNAQVVKLSDELKETTEDLAESKGQVTNLTNALSSTIATGASTPVLDAIEPIGTNLIAIAYREYDAKLWKTFIGTLESGTLNSGSLQELQEGRAYWFRVERDQEVTLCGIKYHLRSGWNPIGWMWACDKPI